MALLAPSLRGASFLLQDPILGFERARPKKISAQSRDYGTSSMRPCMLPSLKPCHASLNEQVLILGARPNMLQTRRKHGVWLEVRAQDVTSMAAFSVSGANELVKRVLEESKKVLARRAGLKVLTKEGLQKS